MRKGGAGAIPPGATIGIFGGGQLGRMTALAARVLGYRIHTLDPDANCSAAPVSDRVITAAFDDVEAAGELGRHSHVVTLEIEQIATSSIDAAANHAPVRPDSRVVGIIQDRLLQKDWLRDNGFPLGKYRAVSQASDVERAARAIGSLYVKSCRGGYDGRAQIQVRDSEIQTAEAAWLALGERAAVAEEALDLAGELSVMVARNARGETAVFPPAMNHHERQALAWSVIPAPLEPGLLERAAAIARGIAETMRIEGLLAVEMFLTDKGDLLVNELAPRPHNSFHATERACVTSQFEQLTRAICDLPMGDTSLVQPAAIVNLFGDIWVASSPPDFAKALALPGCRLHLYGKATARPGRKMGHISATGATPLDALAAARHAAASAGAVTQPLPVALRGGEFGLPT